MERDEYTEFLNAKANELAQMKEWLLQEVMPTYVTSAPNKTGEQLLEAIGNFTMIAGMLSSMVGLMKKLNTDKIFEQVKDDIDSWMK